MTTQHDTTTHTPERILSQAAEDALGICSVAQMLARDDVDCDDPPAAALLIAKQADELNRVLYELSTTFKKGKDADDPKGGNGADDHKAANGADESSALREEVAETILAQARRHGFTVQRSDGKFPFQLVGPKVTVEGLAEQVAKLGGGTSSTNTVERDNEDPLDELTLSLSRAEVLAQAIVDVGMSGEDRDIVGIAVMIRREMEIARNICVDDLHNSKYWRIKAAGGAA